MALDSNKPHKKKKRHADKSKKTAAPSSTAPADRPAVPRPKNVAIPSTTRINPSDTYDRSTTIDNPSGAHAAKQKIKKSKKSIPSSSSAPESAPAPAPSSASGGKQLHSNSTGTKKRKADSQPKRKRQRDETAETPAAPVPTTRPVIPSPKTTAHSTPKSSSVVSGAMNAAAGIPVTSAKLAVKKPILDSFSDVRQLSSGYTRKSDEDRKMRATYNQGSFTLEERRRVEDAVKACLEEFDVPRSDLPLIINHRSQTQVTHSSGTTQDNPYSDKKYARFVVRIREASGINRSVDQLYWYMTRAYCNYRVEGRRWTEEEDERLLNLVAVKGKRWKEIEREIGMTDVKSRWKKLSARTGAVNQGKWSEEEIQKLDDAVKSIMRREGITDPIRFSYWTEAAIKVGTRNDHQCRSKWVGILDKATGKDSDGPIKFGEENYQQLLRRMSILCSSADDDTEIVWDALAVQGEPFTGPYLHRRWNKLKAQVPEEVLDSSNFAELLNYIIQNQKRLMLKRNITTPETVEDEDDDD